MSAPVTDPGTPPPGDGGDGGDAAGTDHLTMGIDPWERNWIRFSIAMLACFFVIVSVAGFAMGFQVPGADAEVDPTTVATEGPFADPGLREVDEGVYDAYVLARAWSFDPARIQVPVGAEVTIYVTSPDLQHGFKITDTNINMQVVPGQVSKLTYTFDEVGVFPYLCTEYCGTAHAAMWGEVEVLSQAEFDALGADASDPATENDEEDDA